ncbi:MAG: DinB family protein [Gemmatirosa sp.]
MRGLVIPRPMPADHSPAFAAEIASVPDGADYVAMLAAQLERTTALVARFGEAHAGLRYAPGKWTVRETVGHLADVERVLSYRLLRFLRDDATPLARFDHEAYVPAGGFEARTLASVLAEFRAVRGATMALVVDAPVAAFARGGPVGAGSITAAALAYLIAGHERHHGELLRTRYLPLTTRDRPAS